MPTLPLQQKFDRILNKHLKIAVIEITKRLQHTAKEEHRYKHRTRNLRNATDVTYKENEDYFDITLKVDNSKASYGKYIIRGHGTWKADPFLNNALKTEESYIYQRVQQAVDNAVSEMNNS